MSIRFRRVGPIVGALLLASAGTFVIGAGPAAASTDTACNDWQSLISGPYQVINSKWGHTLNGWGTGTQCVTRSDSDSAHGWQADVDWSNNASFGDDEYHIKAFPSDVVGWQWGYADSDNAGLPVQLSAEKNVQTSWTFQTQLGDHKSDAIYDLWVDPSTNPSGQPTDEVMVFLDYTDGAHPDSDKVATVSVGGADWDVYRSTGSWQVISFVRTATTSSADLNLRDFLDYSTNAGWLAPTKYLISVQAGFEIWRGTGKYVTTNYQLSVS